MKLFIPEHLLKIKIVEQLKKMLDEYKDGTLTNNGVGYSDSDSSSFDNYKYMLQLDPIKKFLSLCIKESDLSSTQDYDSVINYLSSVFYCVKGTARVFDLMRKYLTSLNITGEIEYTTKNLKITVSNIDTENQEEFNDTLTGFFDALLYYSKAEVEADKVTLTISETLSGKLGLSISTFQSNGIITQL